MYVRARVKVCIDVMRLPIVRRYWVAVRVLQLGASSIFHTPDFLYPACKTFLITVIMLVRVSLMEKLSLTGLRCVINDGDALSRLRDRRWHLPVLQRWLNLVKSTGGKEKERAGARDNKFLIRRETYSYRERIGKGHVFFTLWIYYLIYLMDLNGTQDRHNILLSYFIEKWDAFARVSFLIFEGVTECSTEDRRSLEGFYGCHIAIQFFQSDLLHLFKI